MIVCSARVASWRASLESEGPLSYHVLQAVHVLGDAVVSKLLYID